MKLYKNYIDGKWLASESKDIIQVDDPATGKIIGEISCAKKK
jgi:acyl-CoA reductase-like NAD-dependent aldehyde dehydrogenase